MSVVIAYPPTGQYLGPGLVLTDRAHAVVVATLHDAQRFLARYASEPALVPIEITDEVIAA